MQGIIDCVRFVHESVGPTSPLLVVFGVIVLGRAVEAGLARMRGEPLQDPERFTRSLVEAGNLASLTGLIGTVAGLFGAFRGFSDADTVTPAAIGAAVGQAVGSTLVGAGLLLVASLTAIYLIPAQEA